MTTKGRLAIGATKRAAPALGPRATLGALRSLATNLEDPADRAEALFEAADLARRLEDERTLLQLADLWAAFPSRGLDVEFVPRLSMLAERLLRDRRPRVAAAFARAEIARVSTALTPDGSVALARARYLLGRCLHERDPATALAAYREAACCDDRVVRTSAKRQIDLLTVDRNAGLPRTREALVGHDVPLAERVLRAAGRLERGGRYARAAAIDDLADAARTDATSAQTVGTWALRFVARYADRRGDALTEAEKARIISAFQAPTDDSAGELDAREAEPGAATPSIPDGLARAIEAVSRGHSATRDEASERVRTWLEEPTDGAARVSARPSSGDTFEATIPDSTPPLSVARALHRGAFEQAVTALREAHRAARDGRATPTFYAAAWAAALSSDAESAREGEKLLRALITHAPFGPPRGFATLARGIEGRYPDLARAALERGERSGEPEARERLSRALVEEAWAAYSKGDLRLARAMLRRVHSGAAQESLANQENLAKPDNPD